MRAAANGSPSSQPFGTPDGLRNGASGVVASARQRSWHLVTGEYPPQPGGVSDYTAIVARGLAETGAAVHVWAPGAAGHPGDRSGDGDGTRRHDVPEIDGAVRVHRTAGSFSAADLDGLDRAIDAQPPPRTLLVQYSPNAWRRRGLNLGFVRWLGRRRDRGDEICLVVHEPFYPFRLDERPTRWLLALGQRWMVRSALAASDRVFVAIPAWADCLRPYVPAGLPMSWLPVPSNIPVVDDAAAVADARRRLAPRGQAIIGTFGTYQSMIADLLAGVLPALLAGRDDRVGLLIGGGGPELAARLVSAYPSLAGRLSATGRLAAAAASVHLQACDVLIQPYPDGVSSRRGSVMAGLAHGLPLVSNHGFLSESTWAESGCIALAPAPHIPSIVRRAEELLAGAQERARLGGAARRFYLERFAVGHLVGELVRR